MVSELRNITAEERDAFLAELAALSRRHRIVVDTCCCRADEEDFATCSHFALSSLGDKETFLGYKQDGHQSKDPALVFERFMADVVPLLPQPKPELPTW